MRARLGCRAGERAASTAARGRSRDLRQPRTQAPAPAPTELEDVKPQRRRHWGHLPELARTCCAVVQVLLTSAVRAEVFGVLLTNERAPERAPFSRRPVCSTGSLRASAAPPRVQTGRGDSTKQRRPERAAASAQDGSLGKAEANPAGGSAEACRRAHPRCPYRSAPRFRRRTTRLKSPRDRGCLHRCHRRYRGGGHRRRSFGLVRLAPRWSTKAPTSRLARRGWILSRSAQTVAVLGSFAERP
jgi:hypothetical protein